jgi:PIN domain nuclease of toxin-antitoxin system
VIALDTHAWVWWVASPARIPKGAAKLISQAVDGGERLLVSSISAWEVAMLAERGRLELTMPVDLWISHAESVPLFEFVPVDNRIAVRAVNLPGFPHKDPADRLIVATALSAGATLITGDERLRGYGPLATAW